MNGYRRLLVLAAGAAAALLAQTLSARQQTIAADTARREAAWRANNVGVAHLEQFDFGAAEASFRDALTRDSSMGIARLNLGIALFYGGKAAEARPELDASRTMLPGRLEPDYVLGLIARADDRVDDALAAFSRVNAADPTDVGTAVNLGQVLLQQRKYPEAIERFRAALAAEPYNATAAYGLATALIRSGSSDGAAAMDRFQTLRGSGYAVTFSATYLEQGRYAEAIASTGAEPGLVDQKTPDVHFADASASIPASPAAGPPPADAPGGVALADMDGDGDLDLLDAGPGGVRWFRNDRGRFTAAPRLPGEIPGVPAFAAVAGDYDNDGATDLLILRASGLALLHRTSGGAFQDSTASAGLASETLTARTAAWVDADHDGDLDLVVAGSGRDGTPALRFLRNNGNGTFSDITGTAGVSSPAAVTAIVPTDFDNRRDVDLLLTRQSGGPALFSNRRDGTFLDVAGAVGLQGGDAVAMAAAADVNKDGYVDFFFARPEGVGRFALSDGRGKYVTRDAPESTAGAQAAQFIDYDGDGLLDLLAVSPKGAVLLRNVGDNWSDVTSVALPPGLSRGTTAPVSVASGDVDGDGRPDVVLRSGGALTLWHNDSRRGASLRVGLRGRVSNRGGVGAKVEMRAGSLRSRIETYAASPAPGASDVIFGLGARPQADAVRVLWPSGVLQAETSGGAANSALAGRLDVEELDRKPSSCPFLYAWDGTRFAFVTDFLGGGEMGYLVTPGTRNSPIPEEYVRIPGDRLVARDGRLELRVTNELEEALFLDRLQLIAVSHPAGTEVYPNAGLKETAEPFVLFKTRAPRALIAATDDRGRDVRDALAQVDRQYADGFALDAIRGYAAPHGLVLTLPPAAAGRRLLLLTGWTDYAFSRDNVAAAQRGLAMTPPSLQVEEARGGWRTIVADIGFPSGRPQTVTVDLTGKLPPGATRVRINTTMRIYWDQVVVGESEPAIEAQLARLEAAKADLRWRGFSEETAPDGREPWTYTYDVVSRLSPWKLLPGRYTREGDVRPLLARTDDLFVVSRPGDEIALSFDASALPPLPEGWTRTYLLYGDGFSKEMDLHSSSPDTLDPLPFHGMSSYPYRPQRVVSLDAGPSRLPRAL